MKIAEQTDVIRPVGCSYSPTWDQPIVISTISTALTESVVIQMFDAVDGGFAAAPLPQHLERAASAASVSRSTSATPWR